ncbi:MAG: hypothetical protein CMJ78_08055 [Planctomycetaceae bacterium]|nr:hypothetical protein [Planctomycetaceae bacterium]
MSIANQLSNELKQLKGFASSHAKVVTLDDADGNQLSIDFNAVDSMSCAFEELRLNIPSLDGSSIETIEDWAKELSNRVTYLLENIGPLEFDPTLKQGLVRSTPPDKSEDGTKFYEILLKATGNGSFTLKRYESETGTPGRTQVNLQMTHEQLLKLTEDLFETIP